jgi:hypothetical protein
LVAFSVGFFLSSCNFATLENYFDQAVLNVNPIAPFGGQAAFNSPPRPSVKLVPGTKDQTAPMARREIDWERIGDSKLEKKPWKEMRPFSSAIVDPL